MALIVLVAAYVGLSFWKRPGFQADVLGISSIIGASVGAPYAIKVIIIGATVADLGQLSPNGYRVYVITGALVILIGSLVALWQAFKTAYKGGPKKETEQD